MLNLLAKIFIKDSGNTENPVVRRKLGFLCLAFTLALNIVLFVVKYLTGLIAGSVSIMADSFNNLSDGAGSVFILFGFRLSGMKPTKERPFGHGRIEYIAGAIVSALILIISYETFRDAITSIFNPEDMEFTWVIVGILLASIAVKFYMAFYLGKMGRKIDSAALIASSKENMTDTISTVLTMLSLFLNRFLSLKVDGFAALIVAALLLKNGIESSREALKDLLGRKADPESVDKIKEIVFSFPEIRGIHDLIIHDYGPERRFISMHCEVNGDGDIYVLHDIMDNCMKELDTKLNCVSVIHMDPINTDDEYTNLTRQKVLEALKAEFGEDINIHDYRLVTGPTHTNVIFDALIPHRIKMPEEELQKRIREIAAGCFTEKAFAIVNIDRPYA